MDKAVPKAPGALAAPAEVGEQNAAPASEGDGSKVAPALEEPKVVEAAPAKDDPKFNVGDEVIVKVREIDGRGRINLTRLNIHPDEAAAAREAAALR